jgi:hypothetical protein
MPKKHIFLQNGSSTLGDISLQNVIAHPAEFFVFLMFNNKKQIRWLYTMRWPLKTLNEHFKMDNFAC